MIRENLPSLRVVEEAREYLKAEQLRQISNRLSPGFPLEERIRACSKLFVETRYMYEARSAQRFDTEVFELAPHLDQVLEEMTRQPVSSRL